VNTHSRPPGKLPVPPDSSRNTPAGTEPLKAVSDDVADRSDGGRRFHMGHPLLEPTSIPFLELIQLAGVTELKQTEICIRIDRNYEHVF
jgi:hypothetical protein